MEQEPRERIEKLRIPDENVLEWMETLREGGFNDEEIDRFFSGLNVEYFRAKMPKDLQGEFEKGVRMIEKMRKKELTPDERKKLMETFRSVLLKLGRI